ncbi:helicase HerA domain-containing protein [Mucilaginibacter sp. X5P1]|uniref:helicase HerA domain-containing protein n=1 Tax=Mucilaginibacter sp. X5P1 TaxID=2723088 RepID=UPI0016193FB1|nr:DUF87 domain-containing protein [Mucilaginibacter sp. X5P1]MBB6139887.1 hypothetical protein [Mucilaginibacter sp. X5P1]
MSIEAAIIGNQEANKTVQTQQWFKKLIQLTEQIGDLYSINYETARVIIHDTERKRVGGIPSLCFLIASRVCPEDGNVDFEQIDYRSEDASFILLRVMDSAPLPQDREAERIRVETAQRVSGETAQHWDQDGAMDTKTRVLLGYAGIQCRIIGTFFLEDNPDNPEAPLKLKFGSDISNYYPNRGLKVYKPNGPALQEMLNYCDPLTLQSHYEEFGNTAKVKLGHVRYASTDRKYQQIDEVEFSIYPADLLRQKSALFGMTRTGKSNTTKIIAKSVYELRQPGDNFTLLRVGQIIFDPNGEYANENVQDNNSALKNVWKLKANAVKEEEVVTYGIHKHDNDPDRKTMLINFYLDHNLQIGKEIIDASFRKDEAKYIEGFKQVVFDIPDPNDYNLTTRYNRRVLAYRSLLSKAGFIEPAEITISTKNLFKSELFTGRPNARDTETRFEGMLNVQSDRDNAEKYRSAAAIFQTDHPSLGSLALAFATLYEFMSTPEYKAFDRWYIDQSSSKETWADQDFKNLLEMIARPNGARQIGAVRDNHSASTSSDYAEDIYRDLKEGKLVIIDQSSGEPEINKSSAERIMWYIFRSNQKVFRNGGTPPEILVYIEEAHNLLPAGNDLDMKDIWVRTAKEGAKYRIGMVYATQEVSSIQKNILKNTANWFISHLNNTDETKELCKYYDFIDFEPSIRRAQDKGFLRIKTLSNLFVVPVQADKFIIS